MASGDRGQEVKNRGTDKKFHTNDNFFTDSKLKCKTYKKIPQPTAVHVRTKKTKRHPTNMVCVLEARHAFTDGLQF